MGKKARESMRIQQKNEDLCHDWMQTTSKHFFEMDSHTEEMSCSTTPYHWHIIGTWHRITPWIKGVGFPVKGIEVKGPL